MSGNLRRTRRSVFLGAAGAAAVGAFGRTTAQTNEATPASAAAAPRTPLWRTATQRGIVYGTSAATWQSDDAAYARLVAREAGVLFTEDDLLWYRLKPTPESDLDFSFGDRFVDFAERNGQLVFAAHLVWDEGFGEGWTDDDLWGLSEQEASDLLYGTIGSTVERYKGRVAGWIVVNEAIDANEPDGLRRDYPWYETIGPSFLTESFRIARAADPNALLVLNEFGFETDSQWDKAADKRAKALRVIDRLLKAGAPVQALGVQAHLEADDFKKKFDAKAYRRFLSEAASRGLKVLITEMDALDDGLPANNRKRDRKVADVYQRYLDVALGHPAVAALMTFGLSDRYTWLEEDYPREDGAPRRPLPFDRRLRPKPAFHALEDSLRGARQRRLLWQLPRA